MIAPSHNARRTNRFVGTGGSLRELKELRLAFGRSGDDEPIVDP
jgi:hypothetical protein